MRLFKVTYKIKLPDDYETVTKTVNIRGKDVEKPHARFKYKGKMVVGPLNGKGDLVTLTGDSWGVDFTDHKQTRQRLGLSITNKRAAESLGRNIEDLVACKMARGSLSRELSAWLETIPTALRDKLGKIGLIEPHRMAGSKLISDHLSDFKKSLLQKG